MSGSCGGATRGVEPISLGTCGILEGFVKSTIESILLAAHKALLNISALCLTYRVSLSSFLSCVAQRTASLSKS